MKKCLIKSNHMNFSLLSADTVQRDLNNLGLKDSTYNVHLPPDSGGFSSSK